MTYFADLAECDYFGEQYQHTLRAVGWLQSGKAYSVGTTEATLFAKLKDLLNDPWQPMVFAGFHQCELCQYDQPHGWANLFVPNGTSIFACPELIVHYIASHHYRPPDEFLAALGNCPSMRSMDYKRLILASGGRSLITGPR